MEKEKEQNIIANENSTNENIEVKVLEENENNKLDDIQNDDNSLKNDNNENIEVKDKTNLVEEKDSTILEKISTKDINNKVSIQTNLEVVEEVKTKDYRFVKVLINIIHTGKNKNNDFYYTEDVLKSAIPSLENMPIVAYLKDEKDFDGHRRVGDKLLTSVYGVIPKDNNARLEKKICEDGIERTFLVAEGILWTRYDEVINIFKENINKGQSCELIIKDYENIEDDNNITKIVKEMEFIGFCILGDDVEPACHNADITLISLQDNSQEVNNMKVDIQEKLMIYSKIKDGSEENDMLEKNKSEETDTIVNSTEKTSQSVENETIQKNNLMNTLSSEDKGLFIQYEININELKKEIDELKAIILEKDREYEKLQKDYMFYSTEIETQQKKELLKKYSEILAKDKDYLELLKGDNISKFTVKDLEKELNSIIGRKTLNNSEEFLTKKVYLSQENKVINNPFASFFQ